MTAFGYNPGDGTGNNDFGGRFATRYVNTSGSTVYVDTFTLLNCAAFPGGSVSAQIALYADLGGAPGALLESTGTQTLSTGSNVFSLSTPVAVGPGIAVWAAAVISNTVTFSGSGSAPKRLWTSPINWGGTWPAEWAASGIVDHILPASLSGSTTGPGHSTNLRVPLTISEPLTEGNPSVSARLMVSEPLTEGTPHLQARLLLSEPLTEGDDHLHCYLILCEALYPVEPEGHMSTELFPELPGLTYSVYVTPTFNNKISTAVSGKQNRTAYMKYPIWKFKLTYDYLPDRAAGETDLKNIVGFFCKRTGGFDTFLFNNVDDHSVTAQVIATADGVTLQWPILRTYGGFDEPVGQLNTSVSYIFYKNDVAMVEGTDYSITMPNQLVFSVAPADGDVLTWTGSFYYVCHFSEDAMEFEKFMDKLWQLQECDFESVV